MRPTILALVLLGTFFVPVAARADSSAATGRHISGKQIMILDRALEDQTKGRVAIEGFGFFPPAPNSTTSDFKECRTFMEQVWSVLEKCGYKPYYPDGSHGKPDNGIEITVYKAEAHKLSIALRDSLVASGVPNVRLVDDPEDDAYRDKYLPNDSTLMKIKVGRP